MKKSFLNRAMAAAIAVPVALSQTVLFASFAAGETAANGTGSTFNIDTFLNVPVENSKVSPITQVADNGDTLVYEKNSIWNSKLTTALNMLESTNQALDTESILNSIGYLDGKWYKDILLKATSANAEITDQKVIVTFDVNFDDEAQNLVKDAMYNRIVGENSTLEESVVKSYITADVPADSFGKITLTIDTADLNADGAVTYTVSAVTDEGEIKTVEAFDAYLDGKFTAYRDELLDDAQNIIDYYQKKLDEAPSAELVATYQQQLDDAYYLAEKAIDKLVNNCFRQEDRITKRLINLTTKDFAEKTQSSYDAALAAVSAKFSTAKVTVPASVDALVQNKTVNKLYAEVLKQLNSIISAQGYAVDITLADIAGVAKEAYNVTVTESLKSGNAKAYTEAYLADVLTEAESEYYYSYFNDLLADKLAAENKEIKEIKTEKMYEANIGADYSTLSGSADLAIKRIITVTLEEIPETESESTTDETESESTTDETESESTTDETESDSETESESTTDETESESTTDETESESTTDETESESTTDETESESTTDETESESTTDETESESTTDETESETETDIVIGEYGLWSIGTATVKAGESVTIPVTITGDKNGIGSYMVKIGANGVTATGAEAGSAYADLAFASNLDNLTFSGTNNALTENLLAEDGAVVFYVTFTAPEEAGTYDLTFDGFEVYDVDMTALAPQTKNGWIKVVSPEDSESESTTDETESDSEGNTDETESDSEGNTDETESESTTDETESESTTDETESESTTDETESESTTDETESESTTDETESESTTDETESESTTDETESESTTDETESESTTDETESESTTDETESESTTDETESESTTDETESESTTDETESESTTDETESESTTDETESESTTDETESESTTDETESESTTDETESESTTDETESESTTDETESESTTDETESESTTDETESESTTDETESESTTDETESETETETRPVAVEDINFDVDGDVNTNTNFYFSHDARPFDVADLIRKATYTETTTLDGETTSEVIDVDLARFAFGTTADAPVIGLSPKDIFTDESTYELTRLYIFYQNDDGSWSASDAELYVYIGVKGDANLNGTVNAADSSHVLKYAAAFGAGLDAFLTTEEQYDAVKSGDALEAFAWFLADVTSESKDNGTTSNNPNQAEAMLDAGDASLITKYAAVAGTQEEAPNWVTNVFRSNNPDYVLPKYTEEIYNWELEHPAEEETPADENQTPDAE